MNFPLAFVKVPLPTKKTPMPSGVHIYGLLSLHRYNKKGRFLACLRVPHKKLDYASYSRFFVLPGIGTGYLPSEFDGNGDALSIVSLSTFGANS